MWYVRGTSIYGTVGLTWLTDYKHTDSESVTISFAVGCHERIPSSSRMIATARNFIDEKQQEWISTEGRQWLLNLDYVRETLLESRADWLSGYRRVEPEFEVEEQERPFTHRSEYEIWLTLTISKDNNQTENMDTPAHPVEITDSLAKFKETYPDARRVAFIVMRFGESAAYDEIVSAIRSSLAPHGIEGLRADDRQYHDDIYFNVLTYIYGCDFGIAVYDRLESDYFNPNVAFEVGYLVRPRKGCLSSEGPNSKDDTCRSDWKTLQRV